MRRQILAAAAVAALMAAVPAAAQAQNAVATADVNMRIGPSTGYPVVTVVPAGAPVHVRGCTAGYSWCDTTYGAARGWVSGAYLAGAAPQYRTRRIPDIGAALGIGIIAGTVFELLDDDRDRHDYRESRAWHHSHRESRIGHHSRRESSAWHHGYRESRIDRHGNRESRVEHHGSRESRVEHHGNRESRIDRHDRRESRVGHHGNRESRAGRHSDRESRLERRGDR